MHYIKNHETSIGQLREEFEDLLILCIPFIGGDEESQINSRQEYIINEQEVLINRGSERQHCRWESVKARVGSLGSIK